MYISGTNVFPTLRAETNLMPNRLTTWVTHDAGEECKKDSDAR